MNYDIPQSKDWISAEPVNKGWSSDKKYRITTLSGDRLLLRISDGALYNAKKKEYEIIEKYSSAGIKMSAPREFGVCEGGKSVYLLLSWINGCDLESKLPLLPEKEQYLLGRQAGAILKKIHSLPLAPEDYPAATKKEKKLLQLSRYEESGVRLADDQAAVRFVKENIDRIWTVPPVYLHGDFHPGNLIYTESGDIGVIDFNRWEVGDPYEEFYKLESFGIESSVPYCIGQIDAYFDDDIPRDFWVANTVYVAHASLFSIEWAEKFGEEEVKKMKERAERAFSDLDDLKTIVPKWYTKKYREFK